MNLKQLAIAIGLISTLLTTHAVFAISGNQNNIKPAIFPVSPTTPPPAVPTQFDITGYIQRAEVDPTVCNTPPVDKRLWGGRVVVNGVEIIIPCNTILQMPATSLTWAELFDPTLVPYGTATGRSGLALEDKVLAVGSPVPAQPDSLPMPGYEIHIQGNIVKNTANSDAKHVAGLVFISQQSLNAGQGYIKSIDYATGELCVASGMPAAGFPGQTIASPVCHEPDARVRINDPVGRFGLKHGDDRCTDCDVVESHFDARFTADTDNPTIHAATGYPMCIPRAFPFGADGDTDALCPQQNRPKQQGTTQRCTNLPSVNGVVFPAFPAQTDGYCHSFVMEPLPTSTVPPPGPCGTITSASGTTTIPCTTRSDRQAPFEVGDYIDYSGTVTVDSHADPLAAPYFISAHTINAHVGIYTYPGSKPAYVMIEGLLAGTNALPLQNIPQETTSRIHVEAFTTDPSRLVDIFAMDVDKTTGAITERLLASVNPSGPPVIGRARFVPAAGSFTPATRNLRVVSRTMCNSRTIACSIPKLDPNSLAGKYANGLVAGQYNAPNFDFIFPENLFLGDPLLPNNFQDLAFLACGSGPLTTLTAANNPPIVGPLDPAPWAAPMPAPSNLCASKLANQFSVPTTQTPDLVNVVKATWDNQQNKGKLSVTATSSLPGNTPNLQLYVQAIDQFGVPMAGDPQPMQLITNPTIAPAGGMPCPAANNPCWQYSATGTIVDPLHPRGNPALPNNIYAVPTQVTVYSSRGGKASLTPTLICSVINGVNTCLF